MTLCKLPDRINRSNAAVEMYSHNSARASRQSGGNPVRIHLKGLFLGLHRDRRSSRGSWRLHREREPLLEVALAYGNKLLIVATVVGCLVRPGC